jgi:hypothetical protein
MLPSWDNGRIVVSSRDVQRLTGKCAGSSRTILAKISQNKFKTKDQFVSIEDFADFTGISVDLINKHLTD